MTDLTNTNTADTTETVTVTTTATPSEYLEFVKRNDPKGADAYLESHFGELGSQDEDKVAAFGNEVMALVDAEAADAMKKQAEEIAESKAVSTEEVTSDEVQTTDTDSESTN